MRDLTKTFLTITATSIFMTGTAWAQQAETSEVPEVDIKIVETEDAATSEATDTVTIVPATDETTVAAETVEDVKGEDVIEEIEPAADVWESDTSAVMDATDETEVSTDEETEATEEAPDLP